MKKTTNLNPKKQKQKNNCLGTTKVPKRIPLNLKPPKPGFLQKTSGLRAIKSRIVEHAFLVTH